MNMDRLPPFIPARPPSPPRNPLMRWISRRPFLMKGLVVLVIGAVVGVWLSQTMHDHPEAPSPAGVSVPSLTSPITP